MKRAPRLLATRSDTHREESGSHVVFHELVVERHDLDEALQRRDAHLRVARLRRLAHHLHDEVTLRLRRHKAHI